MTKRRLFAIVALLTASGCYGGGQDLDQIEQPEDTDTVSQAAQLCDPLHPVRNLHLTKTVNGSNHTIITILNDGPCTVPASQMAHSWGCGSPLFHMYDIPSLASGAASTLDFGVLGSPFNNMHLWRADYYNLIAEENEGDNMAIYGVCL